MEKPSQTPQVTNIQAMRLSLKRRFWKSPEGEEEIQFRVVKKRKKKKRNKEINKLKKSLTVFRRGKKKTKETKKVKGEMRGDG